MKNRFHALTAPLNGLTFLQRFILRTLLFLFAPWITIENEEAIPPASDPVIFAFNHNSSFETMFILLYLVFKRKGKKVHFIADWMYGYIPIIGWLIRQTDPIFVFNKQARFGFLNRIKYRIEQKNVYLECFQKLKQNQSIGIFPEGTRNRNPDALKKGQRGIGKIVLKSGVSVLPIGVDFPKRIKYGKIPKFGFIILRVGEKLTFTEDIKAVKRIIQSNELSSLTKIDLLDYFDAKATHQVMLELAKLSGKNYPFKPPEIPEKTEWVLQEILKSGAILCHE
ncbi:1-acyl-sn-glycerol-3-phosphate acyltransferase [candidate division KSB1 bacterium]|nr:1-acyl-sn-glycerol-3-phosphate acyltransferase [candidate division KSB1 bacterium]